MTPLENSLRGRVAFVSGVGSGIGQATAKLLAQAGARIGGFTLKQEEADATAREIAADGGEMLALAGDISSEADVARAVRAIEEKWQRLDIVVANAGINGLWAPLEE